jgi:gluconolactonase
VRAHRLLGRDVEVRWPDGIIRDFMRAMLQPRPAISIFPALIASLFSCTAARAPSPVATDTHNAPLATGDPGVFTAAGKPEPVPSDVAFVSLEGPFWVAAGGYLLFSDVVEANGAAAHIYRFDPGTRHYSILPYPTPTSGSSGQTTTNGLAFEPDGSLLACERYNGRVARVSPAGKLTVVADQWPTPGAAGSGRPFKAPNDLAVRHDGNIYFTDSDWGVRPGIPHGPMGVYRISPRGGGVARVLELEKPNGIALSPDEATLYVGSDVQAKVWKLPVDESGAVGLPTLLIDGARVAGGFKVPDGICVDDAGNLYVTNNDDGVRAIVVFDSSGRLMGRIPFPAAPSNCTFGGADRRTLYATTLHALYEVRMPTPGLP